MMSCVRRPPRATSSILALVAVLASSAWAQDRGFRLHRYDGTSAGSSLFLVERPWYSSVRLLAVGVTGDYSHNPLVPRVPTGRGVLAPIVSQAIVGHVDVALALFDRIQLSASLPVTFLETGNVEAVSQVGPLQGVGLGDPRVGLLVRVAGQADTDPISLHLGVSGWIPVGGAATHQGDAGLRLLPRAILAGAFGAGRWTLDAGFLYRPYASFGPPALGLTAASEARVGLAIGVSLLDERLQIGPEAQYSVQVVGDNAFAINGMNLELLGGAQFLIADHLLIGLAGGAGLLGGAGTPDARGMVRLAWAPRKPVAARVKPIDPCAEGACPEPEGDDPDRDGIATVDDRCPFEPETKNGVRDADGCPEFEMEQGTALARVLAPAANPPPRTAVIRSVEEAATQRAAEGGVAVTKPEVQVGVDAGTSVVAAVTEAEPGVDAGTLAGLDSAPHPDPLPASQCEGVAFMTTDSDGDGVFDEADRCPITPEDHDGFEDEDGCPEADNDEDGVSDEADKCPIAAESANGFGDDDGCPDMAPDADDDGIADVADRCPYEPETRDGVRDDDGCPEFKSPEIAAAAKLIDPPSPLPLAIAAKEPDVMPAFNPNADTDRDGVDDEADRCPVTAEDADGFEDDDGCREPDNDDDGIADARDQCPEVAETLNGWKDDDGCPDEHADLDADGIEYELDRCPFEPGAPSDGCPHAPLPALAIEGFARLTSTPLAARVEPAANTTEPATVVADLDRDGVPDDADPCPMSAEDLDGFEDEDGCPELDNDQDGIADAADKCPIAAETINGNKDDDGCPDLGAGAVTIKENAVVIKGVVRFQTGSATLQAASMPLLKQVAATLRAARTLSIEIGGHTDDVGSSAQNIKLSKRRAETIRAVLIKAGVEPSRLVANGYGPTRPVASNKTAKGREQNRRVEFLILGESK